MKRHVVCRVSELPAGSKRILHTGRGPGIGVFNVGGAFYAIKNTCPHKGAPLCLGSVVGTTVPRWPEDGPPDMEWVRDGEIIRCPWHGWEFELATGHTVAASRNRVKTYEVEIEAASDRDAADLPSDLETYPVTVEDNLVVVTA